nr:hypothetical protein CTI12_AA105810 [Tanacetum cinerariifolium]
MGRVEGQSESWHGHVTAFTLAPELHRQQLEKKLMNFLEDINDKIPLSYTEGTSREISDNNFDGIKELLSDSDVKAMLNVGYGNSNEMDLMIGGVYWFFVEEMLKKVDVQKREGTSNQVKRSKVKKGKKVKKDVSLRQCKRAKQRALFDHEGGLTEHYSRVYDYMQAILDSNPGSTCRLDVDPSNASPTFKRIYICFKGVKDGWLAGCRKVIGLDGCFLKHTCKGELPTAMGRDANSQMYPIAWVVVRVENSENRNSHKGLLDGVHDWLPQAEHKNALGISMPISRRSLVEFNCRGSFGL